MNSDLLKEMAENHILSHEENNRLAILAKNGDREAVDKLLSHNYRLISSLSNRYKSSAYSEEDLFQDGNIGMMNALTTYDETKSSFTTHAFNWIRSEMSAQTIRNNSDFHYNVSFYDKLRKYNRLLNDTGRTKFTDDELSEYGLKRKDLEKVRKYKREACFSMESLTENATSALLDSNDCVFAVEDVVETTIIKKELKVILSDELINRLKPLEKYIILSTFGFDGSIRKLSDLAAELGVSRQYIYKIKDQALEKLKKSECLNQFYLENI